MVLSLPTNLYKKGFRKEEYAWGESYFIIIKRAYKIDNSSLENPIKKYIIVLICYSLKIIFFQADFNLN
jgi:hypothetical protein